MYGVHWWRAMPYGRNDDKFFCIVVVLVTKVSFLDNTHGLINTNGLVQQKRQILPDYRIVTFYSEPGRSK